MAIVVLDGYTTNPGDLSWEPLSALAPCTVWDRTAPAEVIAHLADAVIVLADPYSFAAGPLLRRHKPEGPGTPVLGGRASAAIEGSAPLLLDGEVSDAGAVGCLLRGVDLTPGAPPFIEQLVDTVVRVLDAAVAARLEAHWAGRSEAQRSPAWIERQMRAVQAALKAMSQGLGDQPFCAGNHFTLADVAVGCALGYLVFRFPQIDWRSEHPKLGKLYDKLAARQSFIDSAPPTA